MPKYKNSCRIHGSDDETLLEVSLLYSFSMLFLLFSFLAKLLIILAIIKITPVHCLTDYYNLMVCALGTGRMAVMARFLAAGSIPQTISGNHYVRNLIYLVN